MILGDKMNYERNKNILSKLSLIDKEIDKCKKCNYMVEKFPNSKTVSIGKKHWYRNIERVTCQ